MARFRADERTIVERLRDGLVELIEERGLVPGDKVPTEFELCSEFNVSRPTLREALKLLEQDDMIRVERGSGDRGHLAAGERRDGQALPADARARGARRGRQVPLLRRRSACDRW